MVHTRMSALRWVVGGSETVVRALLEALGPDGTLVAYASWAEHVYRPSDWPAEHRDPTYGRIPERLRTWPGALSSAHPEAGVVAVGARAPWLVEGHPPDDGYGAQSPFARLVEAGGQVLMLGAPLDTVTLLHHAEAIARVAEKRRVTYRVRIAEQGRAEDRSFTDIDTCAGAYPYEALGLGHDDPFAVIARAALAAGAGVRGRVGEAACHLFDAAALVAFATAWLEERFA
jgi:aminoglycoside 3-N-acetyltransferase